MIHDHIIALLQAHDIPYVLHEHAPVRTVADAHALAPHLTSHLVKTIAFETGTAGRFVLAAVASAAQVDYKLLAQAAACTRRDLRLMPAATVEAELGIEVGGLGPFPIANGVEVIVDTEVSTWPKLRCGAGSRSRTLELAPTDLVLAGLARIARVARIAQGTGDG